MPLSIGGDQALSVAPDGTVKAWGSNWAGALGDWTTTDRTTPVSVAIMSDAIAVEAGGSHSLALKADGTVWAWGWNYSGQLGDGSTFTRGWPVQVPGLSNITAIAAGNYHSLALRSDGTVWAWGYNNYGQLGRANYTDSAVPVQVSGLTGATAIAAGGSHSLATKANGTVWAWGSNGDGQIGSGIVGGSVLTATQVSGLSGSFVSVAGGNNHSMARRSDGAVFAWGNNDFGELGDSTYTTSAWPVQAGISGVTDIDAGAYHSMARYGSSSVATWGNNSYGSFGNGSYGGTVNYPIATQSGAAVIAAGNNTGAMVASDGAVKTWGYNGNAQIGNGNRTDQPSPVTLGITQSKPSAPINLEATAGEGLVYLTWSRPATASRVVTQYVITPHVNGIAQAQVATGSTATSYTVSGLSQGTTYTFTVAGQNCLGTGTATAQSTRVVPTGLQLNDDGFKVEGTRLTDRLGLRVNTFNGNVAVQAGDVRVKGTGLDLAVDRAYNNRADATSIFGNNWTATVGNDVKLVALSYGSQMFNGPGGVQLGFAQNADGTYVTPAGISAKLVKNADNTFTLTYHGTGQRWQFNTAGLVTATVDRNANTISYAYGGPGGRLSSITDTQGRVTTFAYDAANLVSSVTDPAGRVHSYGYDAAKNLTTHTNPTSGVTTFAYDANKNLTQITTPAGRVVAFAYDASKRVTSMSRPLMTGNPTTTFAYNAGNTVVTDARNNPTTYTFDPVGRTTKVTDANGVETSASYTSASNVSRSQSGNGTSTTTFGYTNVNSLNSMSATPGVQSTLYYNDSTHPHSPTGITDPQGNFTALAYDANGNLVSQTNQLPSQNQVQIAYGVKGNPVTSTDPNGNSTSYGYDAAGNLTTVTPPAPLGGLLVGYDTLSRITSRRDGRGQTTTYAYDALDRPTTTTFAGGSSVTNSYDADGNKTQVLEAAGTTTMVYDAVGRLTQRVTPDGRAVSYGYDGVGNTTSFTDAGGITTYVYNAVNLPTAVIDPGANTIALGYDARYNRTSVAYPNGYTQYSTYDTSNRLVGTYTTKPPSSVRYTDHAYSYLRAGYQTGLRHWQSDTGSNSYDAINRLTQVAGTTFGYDGAGNRLVQTYGQLGVNATFNAANQLTGASKLISLVGTATGGDVGTNASFDVALPTGVQVGDQILVAVTQSTVDASTVAGYSTVTSASSGSTAADATTSVFRRTATGGETQFSVSSSPGANRVAVAAVYRGVDAASPIDAQGVGGLANAIAIGLSGLTASLVGERLVVFQGATGSTSPGTWTPPLQTAEQAQKSDQAMRSAGVADAPLGQSGATGALSTSLATTQNLPANLTAVAFTLRPAVSSVTYSYDANGNFTGSSDGASATYDAADRTTTMRAAGQTTTSFAYLGVGQAERTSASPATRANVPCPPIGSCNPAVTTVAANATFENTRLGVSAETNGTTTTYYVRDPRGGLLSARTPTGPYYYLFDGRGSVVGLTDATGTVAGTYTYDAYGQLIAASLPTAIAQNNPWRYTGAYQDGTGLYKLGERYYDPSQGRFTQQDPIVDVLDPKLWNRYVYVGNDPINYTDPTGLSWWSDRWDEFKVGLCGDNGMTRFISAFGYIPSFTSLEDNIPYGAAMAVGGVAWLGNKIGTQYTLKGAALLGKISTVGTAASIVASGFQIAQYAVC